MNTGTFVPLKLSIIYIPTVTKLKTKYSWKVRSTIQNHVGPKLQLGLEILFKTLVWKIKDHTTESKNKYLSSILGWFLWGFSLLVKLIWDV